MGSVAEVWYEGLSQEEGSPWANYLKKWTPTSAERWFLDSKKRLGAQMLIVETDGKVVGMNGVIFERSSGKGRFFTGIVVSPGYRSEERALYSFTKPSLT